MIGMSSMILFLNRIFHKVWVDGIIPLINREPIMRIYRDQNPFLHVFKKQL